MQHVMKEGDSVENLQGSLIGALTKHSFDDGEIDHLIAKRARDKTPKDLANERTTHWKQSVAEYQSEKEEALRYQWCSYYRRLAKSHAGIAAHFEDKAAALVDPGEGDR